MQTKTCRACRTVNEDSAIECRNCGARIGEPPGPTENAGGGADLGSQPTTSAPPPPTSVSTSDAGFGPPPLPGEPTTTHPGVLPKRSNTGIMIAFAVVVLALVAGAVYFLTRGGGSLPDELAGHPRSDSEIAQQMEELFQNFSVGGMSFDIALYGESEPVAMMMTFEGLPAEATNVPSEVFFDGFAAGFAQTSGLGGIDPGTGIRDSSNGADFLCVDAPADAFGGGGFGTLGGFGAAQDGAFCVFKGDTIGMVFLFDGKNAASAMPAVQEAYAQIA